MGNIMVGCQEGWIFLRDSPDDLGVTISYFRCSSIGDNLTRNLNSLQLDIKCIVGHSAIKDTVGKFYCK